MMNRVYVDSKAGVIIFRADFVERDAENYKLVWGARRRLIPVDKVLMIEDDGVVERPLEKLPEAPPVQPQRPVVPQTPFQKALAKQLEDVVEEAPAAPVDTRPAQVKVSWSGDATGTAVINTTMSEAAGRQMSGELAKAVFAHPGIKSALTDYQVINLEKYEGEVFLQVRKRPPAGDMKSVMATLQRRPENSPPAKSVFEEPVKLQTDSE